MERRVASQLIVSRPWLNCTHTILVFPMLSCSAFLLLRKEKTALFPLRVDQSSRAKLHQTPCVWQTW